ncbi:MAG: aldo/keto reductase [Oscillospiraceae bacterium]|nr:aldo/keto reductase [Oscillospiraceae bacterium]
MKYSNIGNSDLAASRIALGLMRSSLYGSEEMRSLLETALEEGINFVDNADIYAWKTPSEILFGEVMDSAPYLRDKFIIQTKCGICRGYYDSSYEHIIESAEQSLRRMKLDSIDILLLHRPDALTEPEEVARAFDELQSSGKVRHFGVSNMNPGQIENLKRCVKQDIITDQVEMSLAHAPAIDAGIHVNMMEDASLMRDGSLLDYAQCKGMGIQAWSILQISLHGGSFLENPEYPELNAVLERLAEKYSATKAAVAAAWLLRHPAKIQAIAGTTNPQHLREMAKAADICLTRPEWYELYRASGKTLP